MGTEYTTTGNCAVHGMVAFVPFNGKHECYRCVARLEEITKTERGAGMYEINDPTYPQVKVGKYTICRQGENSVWIQTDDDEGAEFQDSLFEQVIETFWKERF